MNTSTSVKRSPLKFILLIYALSIPFWLLDFFIDKLPLPINLPVSALQVICPALAVCLLVSKEEGFSGVKRLYKSAFDVKSIKKKIWYIPIILLSPFIMLLSYWYMLLSGQQLPTPSIPFLMIPLFLIIFFFAALCEEVGWMGYAAPPMQDRWSALTTGIILGTVWAAWHIIPWLSANPPLWVAGQALSTIGLRILIVWLYNNTGRSILSAILFHDVVNISQFLFPNYGSHYDPIISGAITLIFVVIITFLWGPKTLARYRYAHPQTFKGESSQS